MINALPFILLFTLRHRFITFDSAVNFRMKIYKLDTLIFENEIYIHAPTWYNMKQECKYICEEVCTMDRIWMRINELAEANNGFVRTAQVEELGISRPMLRKYTDAGKLEQVRKGLYVLTDGIPDEYALLQEQCRDAVFSYGTALYLWELSDRTPHIYDITIPRGKNVTILKRNNPNLRCHYLPREFYEIGITQTRSPQGAEVMLYDKERCICDLIRNKEQMDMQLYTQAIKDYFKAKPNNRKLLKYGKLFGIEDKIRTYMEVL